MIVRVALYRAQEPLSSLYTAGAGEACHLSLYIVTSARSKSTVHQLLNILGNLLGICAVGRG